MSVLLEVFVLQHLRLFFSLYIQLFLQTVYIRNTIEAKPHMTGFPLLAGGGRGEAKDVLYLAFS